MLFTAPTVALLPFLFATLQLAALESPFKPDFESDWTSTYGPIHWNEQWYGQKNNTLSITKEYWDDVDRVYVARGRWGRLNDKSYQGAFEFRFDGPKEFSGWWTQDGVAGKTAWIGKVVDPDAKKPAAPHPLTKNAKFKPNLAKPWNSTYGVIHWTEGWYGVKSHTITVKEQGWDKLLGSYVVRGVWGRRGNDSYHGPFEFTFSNPASFSGWWTTAGSTQRTGWSGTLQKK